jgi:hypothetical protein
MTKTPTPPITNPEDRNAVNKLALHSSRNLERTVGNAGFCNRDRDRIILKSRCSAFLGFAVS